jgi:probable rRNA maturation factor
MRPLEIETRVDVVDQITGQVEDALLAKAVNAALRAADTRVTWLAEAGHALEVSVRVTDDAEMRSLNRDYRGVDQSTDVLSFSFVEDDDARRRMLLTDAPVQLGELFLSYEYCVRQAEELGHSTSTELAWLTIHGTLQLVGFAHETDAEAELMEGLETQALKMLGIEIL